MNSKNRVSKSCLSARSSNGSGSFRYGVTKNMMKTKKVQVGHLSTMLQILGFKEQREKSYAREQSIYFYNLTDPNPWDIYIYTQRHNFIFIQQINKQIEWLTGNNQLIVSLDAFRFRLLLHQPIRIKELDLINHNQKFFHLIGLNDPKAYLCIFHLRVILIK